MERNTVACADALDWLRALPAGSVDCFWASPPYNLADPFRSARPGAWGRAHTYAAGSGKGDGAEVPEAAYQDEQAAVLTEWHRVLRDDGVAFYNHKVRIKDGRAISPLAWLVRTPFVLLQELVWDRHGTPNTDDRRFLPVSERIYVLAKRPGLRLRNPERRHDVLRYAPPQYRRAERGHPCPTPPAVVAYCLGVLPQPDDGRRLLVADCYAGTGTTGLVARSLEMDYLLCDHAPAYTELMRRALASPQQAALIA